MNDDNVVDLKLVREETRGLTLNYWSPDDCVRHSYIIDREANEATCSRCKKSFNLMAVLIDLCNQESMWMHNRKYHYELMAKLEKKKRTKCEHCNKLTRINI